MNNNMTSIAPLVHQISDNEVKEKAKQLFEQMKQSTGTVPKWMRVMANCDDVLISFFSMFKAIMDDAPVDKHLKWRIALIISDLNKCEFCVSVAKQQLHNFGLSEQEINNLDNQMVSEAEASAIEYAKASSEHAYNIPKEIFNEIKKYYTDAQIVEISSVVGLFNFINRFNDSLGVLPDVA
jgi:uncharacterized peroxidase-related enzyme